MEEGSSSPVSPVDSLVTSEEELDRQQNASRGRGDTVKSPARTAAVAARGR
ncbi:hypothetical protein GBF38_018093 [Nibea albiflora]|uniref:Uncharacterized protein n=1 Tax=Nibea albiflora TaxID=240163 RepID=A0ACB7EFL6_NIBAL|nr:hypothetical protein GBF38_018093 [Nibea albiflora]